MKHYPIGMLIAAVLIAAIIVVLIKVPFEKRQESFLFKLRNLKAADIERIEIDESTNKTIITDKSLITSFAKALESTELWQPHQPLIYKTFKVAVHLQNSDDIELDFSLDSRNTAFVFIYYFKELNGRFKNAPLYSWIENLLTSAYRMQ